MGRPRHIQHRSDGLLSDHRRTIGQRLAAVLMPAARAMTKNVDNGPAMRPERVQ